MNLTTTQAELLAFLPEGDYQLTRWWDIYHWIGKHTWLHVVREEGGKVSLSLGDGLDTVSPGTWFALDFEDEYLVASYRATLFVHLEWYRGHPWRDGDEDREKAKRRLAYTFNLLSRYKHRIAVEHNRAKT